MNAVLLPHRPKGMNGTIQLFTDTQAIGKKVAGVGAVVLFGYFMYKIFSYEQNSSS